MAQIITRCIALCLFTIATLTTATGTAVRGDEPVKQFRVGMIGLDTSHCLAFADLLNNSKADPALAGCRVVLVYPKGSPDIESSVKRVPEYTTKIKEHGVEIIEDLNAMVEKVDAVMLETNDGRPHLEQVIPVLKARKPVFIDKPVAGSLTDAIAIYELAKHYNTPVFSSSSLRFAGAVQAVRAGSIGDVVGCDAFSWGVKRRSSRSGSSRTRSGGACERWWGFASPRSQSGRSRWTKAVTGTGLIRTRSW